MEMAKFPSDNSEKLLETFIQRVRSVDETTSPDQLMPLCRLFALVSRPAVLDYLKDSLPETLSTLRTATKVSFAVAQTLETLADLPQRAQAREAGLPEHMTESMLVVNQIEELTANPGELETGDLFGVLRVLHATDGEALRGYLKQAGPDVVRRLREMSPTEREELVQRKLRGGD
ncbi:hypothetical protein PAPYR_5858 [Paratrimastix pyriformis]|uniref:Uncharacterized protein n=1 Tax=Paratrimastix pyriformis TaxID=342808 RepID=A0ABQ8UJR3_9EUKA|nr:hypothetical protein PAPYR_5858 [Paratrimastix pyriformis]